MVTGQLTELEDTTEYKGGEKAAVDVEEEEQLDTEKTVEDSRKYSVDSGVIIIGGGADGDDSDKSTDSEDNKMAIDEEMLLSKSVPNSPAAYNLRRRPVDFKAYR